MPPEDGEKGALESAREALYRPAAPVPRLRAAFARASRLLPQEWRDGKPLQPPPVERHHVTLASYFFFGAIGFFTLALVIAGVLLYLGGVSVSVNNIKLAVQGPTTIAGGDTVPLTIAITNRNTVAINNAVLEADFPPGTRSTDDVLTPLVNYHEELGTIESGQTITRSVKAVIFGASGATVSIPVSLSYGTQNANSTFVKKSTYAINISSTPLSISADTIAETLAGKEFTVTLQVRSNATVAIDHALVTATLPFGFTLTSSSVAADGNAFALGTLAPGESRTLTLTGTLDGQDGESRVFHFSVGTGATGSLDVTYMTQDATVAISAPFITTALALNGSTLANATLSPGASESVTASFTNTLASAITDASIAVTLSGSAVDYASVRTTNGFYDSSTHTILFDKGTDPALESLAPGEGGVGAFSFNTVPAASFGRAPSVTFSTSISGTRVGEANVPETITASRTETIKAATAVELSAAALHKDGPIGNTGPIPPESEKATTYTVEWKVANGGSAVAGAAVSATLPSYVTYTGKTNGSGTLSYDTKSRKVTWSAGDLAQSGKATADFQVSLTPSTSQSGTEPALTGIATFTGYDRFAGINVSSTADAVTTETFGDTGYKPDDAQVQ